MDDFGGTFFDLSSSSPPFSFCSTSANTNSNGSSSSFSFMDNSITIASSTASKSLQTQVDDLDSMLLPTVDSSNSNADDPKDLSALLDNLTDDPLPGTSDNNESLNIDSLIGHDLKSEAQTVLNCKPAQSEEQSKQILTLNVSSEKLVSTSSMVQLKLIKPMVGLTSGMTTLNASSMIPVTVHSLTGQKHSIMHTVLPMCGPKVHVLPIGKHPVLSQSLIKQEHQENSEKV